MKVITNFSQANKALADYIPNIRAPHGYTLDRMRELMRFLGNPQNDLRILHVAGTSGKTSTSYYASALLQQAGFRVGLTVSPHVSQPNERVQINLIPLPENEFCKELTTFLDLVTQSGLEPSYFEVLVAFAYWEFKRQEVEYAVIEVGIGGLLDGTNVVERSDKVCIITDIGLDHMNILGNSLPEIAFQKAGIIHHHNETFCHQQDKSILDVFMKRCKAQQARLHIIDSNPSKPIHFLPLFQQRNFQLAEAAVAYTLERDGGQALSEANIVNAAKIIIPARMQVISHGNKTIILDGAHNSQKLHALRESIAASYPGKHVTALISFADGKSFRLESSLKELANLTDTLIITSFQRAESSLPHGPAEPALLAQLARACGFRSITVIPDPLEAYKALLKQQSPILLVTGSFFLMEDIQSTAQKS